MLSTLLVVTATVIVSSAPQESDEEWLAHCRSMRWNGGKPTACEVQVKTIPARSQLTLRPGRNGGVKVIAHDGRAIEVHARMQASDESRVAAERLLERITIDLGETISASGPETSDGAHWSVSFVLYVPRNTNLDATTLNGPIAVRNLVGRMELSAQNGPISLSGVGGDVRARAQNGPLSVRLTGTGWSGQGLDAETRNGPVSLAIPDDYNAELETGTINGPMNTSFPITVTMGGSNWKRLKTTLGKGGAPVRVVTTNGPATLSRP